MIGYFHGKLDIEPDGPARHYIVKVDRTDQQDPSKGLEIKKILAVGESFDEVLGRYKEKNLVFLVARTGVSC